MLGFVFMFRFSPFLLFCNSISQVYSFCFSFFYGFQRFCNKLFGVWGTLKLPCSLTLTLPPTLTPLNPLPQPFHNLFITYPRKLSPNAVSTNPHTNIRHTHSQIHLLPRTQPLQIATQTLTHTLKPHNNTTQL